MNFSLRRPAIVAGFWMLSFLLSWATAVRADAPLAAFPAAGPAVSDSAASGG